MKQRCLKRAAPKAGRKKGRCLKVARPTHAKKSEVPKRLKGIPSKEHKRLVRGRCLKWSKASGSRRCLLRAVVVPKGKPAR